MMDLLLREYHEAPAIFHEVRCLTQRMRNNVLSVSSEAPIYGGGLGVVLSKRHLIKAQLPLPRSGRGDLSTVYPQLEATLYILLLQSHYHLGKVSVRHGVGTGKGKGLKKVKVSEHL